MLESPQRGETTQPSVLRQRERAHELDLPGFYDDDTDFIDEDEQEQERKRRPWWRQRRWLAAIAAVVIVAVIVTSVVVTRSRAPQITYTTRQVTTGNLVTTVSATGSLQSATYDVNFSGSGTIKEIDVSVGQQVKSGQVLAKLDPTSLQDAVNAAQIALNNAYGSYSRAVVQGNAQLDAAYQQEQTAISNCHGNSQCINSAEAQYASTQAQVSGSEGSASSQIASAQQALTTAQHNLSNATLKAPHDGIVGAINGQVGGSPGSGGSSSGSGSGSSSSGGAFIEILDLSSLQVAASVNEADIGKIATGQAVTFTVSAYTGKRFRGTVSSISPIGQSSSSVVTYPVTIDVDTSNLQGVNLLPQMTANVTITTAQRVNVLLIPASAVTFARQQIGSGITRTQIVAALQQGQQLLQSAQSSDTTASADNLTLSFVLERSGGKWVVKPVVLGLSNGTLDEVLAGLSQGETIVTGQTGGTTSATTGTGTGSGLFPGGGGFGGRGGGAGGGRGGGTNGSGAGGATGGGN